jgi:DNA-binding transcriptional ArsR family regulator
MSPIKTLADRRRYIRLGKIRLGVQVEALTKGGKVKVKNGKPVMRPQATEYFVIKEEVEEARLQVLDIYGEEPKELDIRFLFEEEEQTFPQYLKMYRGDGQLRCMGDGEWVMMRRYLNKDKEIDERLISGGAFLMGSPIFEDSFRNEVVLEAWEEQYGYGTDWLENPQNMIPCLAEQCPQYGPRGCRPTGRLLFMIEGIDRLGFWELVVHQHALIGINSQLELTRAFTQYYWGKPTILHVPFKLRLRGPDTMKINGYNIKVWTPEIEPAPEWVGEVVAGTIQLPVPARPQITVKDIWGGDDEEEPKQLASPEIDEDEALDYDPTVSWDGDWPGGWDQAEMSV